MSIDADPALEAHALPELSKLKKGRNKRFDPFSHRLARRRMLEAEPTG
jgi:hypothetical protein